MAAEGPQILLCEDGAQLTRFAALFPKLETRLGLDYASLEGRRVVCLAPHMAPLAVGYAAQVKVVKAEMPQLADKEISAWLKENLIIYSPTKDSPPQSVSAGSPPADSPPPLRSGAGEPDPQGVAGARAQGVAGDGQIGQGWHDPTGEWPAPVDFWHDGVAVPDIDARYLPECIGAFVFDQADLKGVDANQIALNAVVACSGALDNSIGLRPYAGEPDYIEKPVLWGACVGNSSVKKGAAQDAVMGRLRELDIEMRRKTALIMQERKDDAQVYEAKLAAWIRENSKGGPAGERPSAPEPVDSPRLLVENFTMEGLRGVLEHNGRGKVFGCFDEIASLFGNLDAYSAQRGANKDAPQLLKLYESKAGIFDRAPPAPPVYIKSWAASIVGGIQPGPLQRTVERQGFAENGMLQRFMLAVAKPAKIPQKRDTGGESLMRWNHCIEELVAMRPNPEPVRYSEGAQMVMESFTRWIYEAAAIGASDGLTSAIGKFEGLFHRLCLVFHCAKSADAGTGHPLPEVSEDTAQRVDGFIREFLFYHTRYFYRELETSSPHYNPIKSIAGLILAQSLNTLTVTHLWRHWSGWRKCQAPARREIMQGLCEAGWLRKRSETSYAVNPSVHSLLAERAEQERVKRAEYARVFEEKVLRHQRAEREAGED